MRKTNIFIPILIYLVSILVINNDHKHQIQQLELTYQFREALIINHYEKMVKNMGVNLTGDWDRLMDNLENVARKFSGETGQKIGKSLSKIERTVLKHIDEQDLGHEELSDQYAKRKEKKGLSPDILRASNQMYENITTYQDNDFEGAVGVSRGVKNAEGEEVTDIAIIHEQPEDDGTIIPARKVWKPSFKEVEGSLPAEITGMTKRMFNA